MINRQVFWDRINALVEDAGITYKQLCNDCNLNYPTLKNWRYRHLIPSVEELLSITERLGVSMDYIVTGEEAEAFSEEAILVEHDDKLKAVVRACERNPHLLEVIAVTVESMEQVARA